MADSALSSDPPIALSANRPKLLDQLRDALRLRHRSRRTEDAYVHWVRRFIVFHDKRHPRELGAADVGAFLTALAVRHHVSASTQNQALGALLFLYQHVLARPLAPVPNIVRAPVRPRLPVVLTRDEVRALFAKMDGTPRLVARLLYGGGLRLLEGLSLRIKTSTAHGISSSSGVARATRIVLPRSR